MTLNFKPTTWQAESDFITATITRSGRADAFAWEIYSKIDNAVITSGTASSLSKARQRCKSANATIEQAEAW
jgi:predicted HNH restriction endonuclease